MEILIPGEKLTANHLCTIEVLLDEGKLWNLYKVEHNGRPGLLKISSSEDGDESVINEAFSLTGVRKSLETRFLPYLPTPYDVFDYNGSQCIVTEWLEGFFSLQEVIEAYPEGIDPKDMAWIFRRLLVVIGAIHRAHFLHGAVLPANIFIHPGKHGLVLSNWSCATTIQEDGYAELFNLKDPSLGDWYPGWDDTDNTLDILLAARTMTALLGGDPIRLALPVGIPKEFRAFFQACVGPHVPDAWELKTDFDDMIEMLWGKRKFHPFFMPENDTKIQK